MIARKSDRMPVLGIDIGTQSLKVVILSDDLSLLGDGTSSYQPRYPQPGWADQDSGFWAIAVKSAVATALEQAQLTPADISAVGVASQLDGAMPCSADGTALGPCILWLDRRATAEAECLEVDVVRNRTGLVRDATHMAPKIAWLRTHDAAGKAAALFHQPVTWMVHQLTGRAVIDHALASTTMVYDLATQDYAPDLLQAFGLDEHLLPSIADAASIAGLMTAKGAALTGLLPGTPVAVGTGDDFASPLGSGVKPGMLACTLGTAEVVGALHDQRVIDAGGLVETHGFAGGGYFIYNPGWLSGGVITWILDLLSVPSPEALSTLAASAPAGADGILFLPSLSGAMAPEWEANARGCFYGLTPAHTKAHCARAVLEGLAFAMRDVLERLQSMGVPIDRIRLMGGGARSSIWPQIRADVTGLPIEVLDRVDASPVGAAVLAAVATGLHATVAGAASLAAGPVTMVQPDPAVKPVYDRAYARYHQLYHALKPLYTAPAVS